MPDLGVVPLFYPARPRLVVDGVEDAALGQGVIDFFAEEGIDGLARAELTVGNWGSNAGTVDFLYFGRDLLEFGKSLSVEMGAGAAAGRVFEGLIMGLEGRFPTDRPPELLVLAEDRLQALRMTRRSRSFEDVTLDDVASSIASDHGLSSAIDVESPAYRVLAQLNQSDLAFLRQAARDVDAEVWVEGDTLHVQSRGARNAGEVTLTYGRGLHECQILADLAEQRTSVGVGGWDVGGKSAVTASADASALGGEVRGTSGVAVLEQTIGARHEQLVHTAPANAEQGQSVADAHMRQRARRFVTGRATAEGDSRLRVGSTVNLQGVGPLFNGAHTVTRVRHAFEMQGGFRTTFHFERPDIER